MIAADLKSARYTPKYGHFCEVVSENMIKLLINRNSEGKDAQT